MRTRSGHVMSSRKRRREEVPIKCTIPPDLLLEIAARCAPHAFFRFAATCKFLHRDILSTSFIRRVTQQVAPYILVSCTDRNKPFTLLHPATPAVASFCHNHLFLFFLRHAADLFDEYWVETSRCGLVLFRRWHRLVNSIRQPRSNRCSDLCIYDPMNGARTVLSCPHRNPSNSIETYCSYVLLTAADGIDRSFMLLMAEFDKGSMEVQTTSSCGTWKHVTYLSNHNLAWSIKKNCNPAVQHGGVINWLVSHYKAILSYDLGRQKVGSVKLPPTNCKVDRLQLTTSSDGKLLKLLAIERFMMSVWLQVPISKVGGCGWSLKTVIDMEDKLRSLHPDIPINDLAERIVCNGSAKRNDVVLLKVVAPGYHGSVIVFDLETKDMCRKDCRSELLEIDLPSRLQNMKVFS